MRLTSLSRTGVALYDQMKVLWNSFILTRVFFQLGKRFIILLFPSDIYLHDPQKSATLFDLVLIMPEKNYCKERNADFLDFEIKH